MKSQLSSLLVPFALLAATPAAAIVHLWDIVEIYSNADGSTQYIELFTDGRSEIAMSLAFVESNANAVNIDENLTGSTFNHSYLLATPGFENLPGVEGVVPDFTIDPGFFSVDGDTISFSVAVGVIDTLTFGVGELPTDGTLSLNRPFGTIELMAGTNSPTNFAGMSGTLVPEPPDEDDDGIPDAEDNCTEVPNADQRDTNLDGYGNLCDADLNNDDIVNFGDLLGWILFQGFQNIGIRPGIPTKQLAKNGHATAQVTEINTAPNRVGRFTKIKHQDSPSRPAHAPHLLQALLPIC